MTHPVLTLVSSQEISKLDWFMIQEKRREEYSQHPKIV
jgi:hypothetical protein